MLPEMEQGASGQPLDKDLQYHVQEDSHEEEDKMCTDITLLFENGNEKDGEKLCLKCMHYPCLCDLKILEDRLRAFKKMTKNKEDEETPKEKEPENDKNLNDEILGHLEDGEKSEGYKWVFFFRDVAGWIEDANAVRMGGPGVVVEGDGTFVIGKRKNAVGRMRSKEHVYVITQRGSRKIRRIVRVF